MKQKRYKLGQIVYIVSKDYKKTYTIKSKIIRIQYNEADEDYHYQVKPEPCESEIDMWYSCINKTLEGLKVLAFTKKNDAIDYHNQLVINEMYDIQKDYLIK